MAVRSKAEILELIRERVGDDTSDEALTIIEDITDTLDDYDARIAGSGDWQRRYEENDAEWRQRYRDRFFGSGNEDLIDDDPEDPEDEPEKPQSFDDLFK